MKHQHWGIAALLAGSWPAMAAADDDCRFEAEHSAVVDAVGARLLDVVARAGELRIEGRSDLTEVRVTARACASHERLLDEIRLAAERRGDSVHVEALMPEGGGGLFRQQVARLDIEIEAPAGITADVDDTSGSLELRALGELRLNDSSGGVVVVGIAGPARIIDSSGALHIEDVAGALSIDDSSGAIHVARVDGDVDIEDSSGEIVVREVTGAVELADSSGGIEVTQIGGSVTVRADSSGSIHIRDVGGDFVLMHDSSGGVVVQDVRGTVSLPDR